MKTIIVGLGNPYLTDDGVGVRVAYEVDQCLPEAARTDTMVTEASVGGLRLMEMMDGFERGILIDAMTGQPDSAVGDVQRFTLDDLDRMHPTAHTSSAHDTTLPNAMKAGRIAGLDLPDEIVIFAVSVQDVATFGDAPTPKVASAIPKIVSAVIEELQTTAELPI